MEFVMIAKELTSKFLIYYFAFLKKYYTYVTDLLQKYYFFIKSKNLTFESNLKKYTF